MAKRHAKRNNRSTVFMGMAIVLLAIALAALMHNSPTPTRGGSGTNSDIIKRFDSELNMSRSLSDIGVEYAFGNTSAELKSGAQQTHVSESETIYSYRFGGYSKAVTDTSLSYVQGSNTLVSYSNITSYFNTPQLEITCINQSVYRAGISNAIISCIEGASPVPVNSFPVSINASAGLASLTQSYSVSYMGQENISGRMCNDYLFRNASQAASTTYDICLDGAYGIPVYINRTVFHNGTYAYSTYLILKRIYRSLNSSDFTIPNAYMYNISARRT